MSRNPLGPTVDARVIELAGERFGSAEEARSALVSALEEISDEQLSRVRAIQVLMMMEA